ncbi:hypothetical protein AAMO2058_000813900 [Amorphochlora amoebiformis]
MAAVRKFALPVERPGGRYITRIQMKRMKEAAIEAAKFSEKESGLGVMIKMLRTPMKLINRHRVKVLVGVLCGSGLALIFLASVVKKFRDELRQKKTQLKRIENLLLSRLEYLQKLRPGHWDNIREEMEGEVKDCTLLKTSPSESYISMLFDELLTLTAQVGSRSTSSASLRPDLKTSNSLKSSIKIGEA